MHHALQNIIHQLANNGERNKARQLLMGYVKKKPQDASAWYMLSFLVEKQEQKIDCLQFVLKLDPNNTQAKQRLQNFSSPIADPTCNNQEEVQSNEQLSQIDKQTIEPDSASTITKQKVNIYSPHTRKQFSKEGNKIARPTHGFGYQGVPLPEHKRSLWHTEVMEPVEPRQAEQSDILEFLFDDIGQLPIITSPHQELWLGVQLQVSQRLNIILNTWQSKDNQLTFSQLLWESLLNNMNLLDKECLDHELPLPRFASWVTELLTARSNIYELRRSRLRRFIRRIQSVADQDTADKLLNLTYTVIETIAIFSGKELRTLNHFITNHNRIPLIKETAEWPPINPEIAKQQSQNRIKQTEHLLIVGYLRYAIKVARNHMGQGLDFADLAQAGFMGLMRAAQKFDYRLQARFGTYAVSWIWQNISRVIANEGRTIRMPAHFQENLRKWEAACDKFDNGYQDTTHNPDILLEAGLLTAASHKHICKKNHEGKPLSKKVAELYRQAVEKAQKLALYSTPILSLTDIKVTIKSDGLESDSISLIDSLLDERPLPDVEIDLPIIRSEIEDLIFPLLTDRELQILQSRCGWADGQELTLAEIGEQLALSRERIRQIEAKALDKLQQRIALGYLPNLYDLLPDHKPTIYWDSGWQEIDASLTTANNKQATESNRLDHLIANLPRSNWVKGRTQARSNERQEQLTTALQLIGTPAHTTDIADQLNDLIEGTEVDETNVYNLLIRNDKKFILLGQGVFSLIEWEEARAKENSPILACCPMPLPDPPDYEDAFFESVLVGQQALAKDFTAEKFVCYMLAWSKSDRDQQKWFMQNILSAYYLVDLIPYVFYFSGLNPVLTCTLPSGTIQELRYHCLATLTERLVAMPEFWWLMQQNQPIRPTDLGEIFIDFHPYGLDDTLQRLRLLASLGAVQKLRYGDYRLTTVGEDCANRWKKKPIIEIESIPESEYENDFIDFTIW
jgi:RNA polymerase primary sigma factor